MDENALSSLRRDGTRVGNKMSLLPSVDFELASLDGDRSTRHKRRRFGFQEPLVSDESDESCHLHRCEVEFLSTFMFQQASLVVKRPLIIRKVALWL